MNILVWCGVLGNGWWNVEMGIEVLVDNFFWMNYDDLFWGCCSVVLYVIVWTTLVGILNFSCDDELGILFSEVGMWLGDGWGFEVWFGIPFIVFERLGLLDSWSGLGSHNLSNGVLDVGGACFLRWDRSK